MSSGKGTTNRDNAGGLRSMTGFAAASGAHDPWQFTLELRGVNGKGLDIRARVPDWIEGFETEARKRVQARIGRGNLTLSVRVTREVPGAALRLDDEALSQALDTLHQIETAAEAKGLTLRPMSAAEVATLRGVLETGEDTADDTKPLAKSLLQALDALIADFDADRAREGLALAGILTAQLDQIDALRQEAFDALGDRAEAQRGVLMRNLAKLLDAGDMPDEARLAQELALIAVKSDVAEEIDRLTAHVDAARSLLAETGPVGRKFDFLMQEFNREANTLCSKAQSAALTQIGLSLKTIIDQMREQVQNVE